jgi:hypothetical protein
LGFSPCMNPPRFPFIPLLTCRWQAGCPG